MTFQKPNDPYDLQNDSRSFSELSKNKTKNFLILWLLRALQKQRFS
jgi:hypothetical protein